MFDGLTVGDPTVTAVADLLHPAVTAELGYWSDETQATEFPELSGPLFLIGGYALFDATLTVVGTTNPSRQPLPCLRAVWTPHWNRSASARA